MMVGGTIKPPISDLMEIIEFWKAHAVGLFYFFLLFLLLNGKNFLLSHEEGGKLWDGKYFGENLLLLWYWLSF
jgi:hypothetical protein